MVNRTYTDTALWRTDLDIGVSSYSFSKLVRKGDLTELGVVAQAKEMGFDFLEFAAITVPEGERLESYADRLRKEADRVGIPIQCYAIWADFINGSGGDVKAEAERLQSEIRVAEILGAPRIRHDATRGFNKEHRGPRDFDAALPILAEGCRLVTRYAADRGIETMVENHGQFCQDSERVEKLANAVNHPNFGLLVDMGNFLCVDEDPCTAFGRVLPYAFHVHAKDFHVKPGYLSNPGAGWFTSRAGNYLRGAVVGHGEVAVAQCLELIQQSDYDGALAIEFEGMEDPILGISVGRDNLLWYLSGSNALT